MATYKKMLKDKDGNNIIPALGGGINAGDLSSELKKVTTFTFYDAPTETVKTYNIRTSNGKDLVLKRGNAGTNNIIEGVSGINHIRVTCRFALNNVITDSFGCGGLATNATLWTYYYGVGNGTHVGNSVSAEVTSSGALYGYQTSINVAGNKRYIAYTYDVIRLNDDTWTIQGSTQCAGSGTALSYCIEAKSVNSNVCPSLYSRGAGSSNVTSCYLDIQIFE